MYLIIKFVIISTISFIPSPFMMLCWRQFDQGSIRPSMRLLCTERFFALRDSLLWEILWDPEGFFGLLNPAWVNLGNRANIGRQPQLCHLGSSFVQQAVCLYLFCPFCHVCTFCRFVWSCWESYESSFRILSMRAINFVFWISLSPRVPQRVHL